MRTTEPTTITQGERIEWTKTFSDYPATLYTLQYRFRGNGIGINVDATADDTAYAIDLTAALSAQLQVMTYSWQAWVTEIADATNTFPVANGRVTVKAGFAASSVAAVDLRSQSKQTLDAINAAINGTATKNHSEYEVQTPTGSRRIKRLSLKELLEAREVYARIVAQENAAAVVANGGTFGTSVKVRMYER